MHYCSLQHRTLLPSPVTSTTGCCFCFGSMCVYAAAAAKSLQSCPTRLPRPWDFPGKNTGVGCHFLLQCMKVKSESAVTQSCLLATPWTAASQAPPSMGFSRQEYWSGVPLPSPDMHTSTQKKLSVVTEMGLIVVISLITWQSPVCSREE